MMAAIRDQAFRDFVFAMQETGCQPSEVSRITAAHVKRKRPAKHVWHPISANAVSPLIARDQQAWGRAGSWVELGELAVCLRRSQVAGLRGKTDWYW